MPTGVRSRSSSTSALIVCICTTSAAASSNGLPSPASRSSPSSTKARAGRPTAIAAAIDVELRRNRNPARAPMEKAYLKSDLVFMGVGLPAMRQIVDSVKREHGGLDRSRLVSLGGILWKPPVFEWREMAGPPFLALPPPPPGAP